MREIGGLLITIGIAAIFGAFAFVDLTRDIGYIPSSPYTPSMPREVANLHAMHVQGLIFHGGLISFLSGVVCAVGALLRDSIQGRQDLPPVNEPTPAAAPLEAAADVEPEITGSWEKSPWVAFGLLAILVAVVVFGIIVSSSNSRSSSSSASGDNAIQPAMDALNASAEDLENQADEVAREMDRLSGRRR